MAMATLYVMRFSICWRNVFPAVVVSLSMVMVSTLPLPLVFDISILLQKKPYISHQTSLLSGPLGYPLLQVNVSSVPNICPKCLNCYNNCMDKIELEPFTGVSLDMVIDTALLSDISYFAHRQLGKYFHAMRLDLWSNFLKLQSCFSLEMICIWFSSFLWEQHPGGVWAEIKGSVLRIEHTIQTTIFMAEFIIENIKLFTAKFKISLCPVSPTFGWLTSDVELVTTSMRTSWKKNEASSRLMICLISAA